MPYNGGKDEWSHTSSQHAKSFWVWNSLHLRYGLAIVDLGHVNCTFIFLLSIIFQSEEVRLNGCKFWWTSVKLSDYLVIFPHPKFPSLNEERVLYLIIMHVSNLKQKRWNWEVKLFSLIWYIIFENECNRGN